jgi:hypothetical protein
MNKARRQHLSEPAGGRAVSRLLEGLGRAPVPPGGPLRVPCHARSPGQRRRGAAPPAPGDHADRGCPGGGRQAPLAATAAPSHRGKAAPDLEPPTGAHHHERPLPPDVITLRAAGCSRARLTRRSAVERRGRPRSARSLLEPEPGRAPAGRRRSRSGGRPQRTAATQPAYRSARSHRCRARGTGPAPTGGSGRERRGCSRSRRSPDRPVPRGTG